MPSDPTLASLSPASRHLVELITAIRFGRIEGLRVCKGEPQFEPAPRIVRTLKMNGRNESRPRPAQRDFAIQKEVVELLEQIRQLRSGCVPRIEIAHGIPLFAEIEEPLRYGTPE